jgi:hypothetical protein
MQQEDTFGTSVLITINQLLTLCTCRVLTLNKELYVWLTVNLELYSCNKPTRCTVYLHFIELPHLDKYQAYL